jgi:hypothetical protein
MSPEFKAVFTPKLHKIKQLRGNYTKSPCGEIPALI